MNPYTSFTSYLSSTPLPETLPKSFQKHDCHQSPDPATHHSKTLKDLPGLTGSLGAVSFPPPSSPHPPLYSSIMSQNNLLLSLLQTPWCIRALEFCSCSSHLNALPSPLWILESHHPSKHSSAMMPFLTCQLHADSLFGVPVTQDSSQLLGTLHILLACACTHRDTFAISLLCGWSD